MLTTRRQVLALAGTAWGSKLFAAFRPARFNVDRLLDSAAGQHAEVYSRKYVASAAVVLFSIPLVSKRGVGTGYTVIEEVAAGTNRTVALQFGAGSYPESARGLNRLGFVQEVIVERQDAAVDCAYLAFMTTSQEKNLDQAKQALASAGSNVAYSAAQGVGHGGKYASRVDRLEFPARYTWRDIPELIGKAREEMAGAGSELQEVSAEGARISTFLYAVRRALQDPGPHAVNQIFFNSKRFELRSWKERDDAAGAYFTAKKIASGAVIRLNAMLTEHRTGEKTPFRLWYEKGAEKLPPLKFEYQARSFLRLSFEADAAAAVPPIPHVLNNKENV
jgi:hypothetical protein